MVKRFAIIDMGTNTFHLLLAEATENGRIDITQRDRVAVKIGKGGINRGEITVEAVERAVAAMMDFKAKIDQNKVDRIYAFGTSALRSASNGSEVLNKIKSVTGISVNIINGDTEAEYIYQGVRYALEIGPQKSLIIDIGGGSVEFIIANNHRIFWKESFEIGAQRLLEMFHHNDPITRQEIAALDNYFDNQLTRLFDALHMHPSHVLIGVSGTFDTLSDIFCEEQGLPKGPYDPETPLTLGGFYSIYESLKTKNREQRMAIPGMIEMRVDMIVVAVCLVRYILSRHHFERIRVCSYSLKEGVLASLAKRLQSVGFDQVPDEHIQS
jgi:exopolyphosphatase/guanosine-5'-triphosphate,3'-diphosphate pyrophosphatase